jgi:hypothetical protein
MKDYFLEMLWGKIYGQMCLVNVAQYVFLLEMCITVLHIVGFEKAFNK